MPYNVTEDNWTKEFCWFLIDNGEILYSFKDRHTAETFMKNMNIDYWFLTDLKNITHETMLDPSDFRSWNEKTQTCVEWIQE